MGCGGREGEQLPLHFLPLSTPRHLTSRPTIAVNFFTFLFPLFLVCSRHFWLLYLSFCSHHNCCFLCFLQFHFRLVFTIRLGLGPDSSCFVGCCSIPVRRRARQTSPQTQVMDVGLDLWPHTQHMYIVEEHTHNDNEIYCVQKGFEIFTHLFKW